MDQEVNHEQTEKIEKKVEVQAEVKSEKKSSEKELELIDILKLFSPGTALRSSLDEILKANLGALIIFDKDNLFDIVSGGFKVNCRFSSQRLFELSKMDGAIILSGDLKKILFANSLLVPDMTLLTKETGTRHKAAERTAKQFKTVAIAISERKSQITIYYKSERYILEETSEILRRAAETLQTLEKQREIYDELLSNLNVLEINGLVTINDVSGVLQRLEMNKRISSIAKRYLVELGKEGVIVSMRLKELTRGINRDRELILQDYFGSKYLRASSTLDNANFDFLLEISNISRILFNELHDKPISPRGIRLLSKTNILEKNIKLLLTGFKRLDNLIDATDEELTNVLNKIDLVKYFKEELQILKEKIMSGKKI